MVLAAAAATSCMSVEGPSDVAPSRPPPSPPLEGLGDNALFNDDDEGDDDKTGWSPVPDCRDRGRSLSLSLCDGVAKCEAAGASTMSPILSSRDRLRLAMACFNGSSSPLPELMTIVALDWRGLEALGVEGLAI